MLTGAQRHDHRVRKGRIVALRRRHFTAALTLMATAAALCLASPVSAAPKDPEGGSKTLREQLDDAAKGHITATNKLQNLQKKQLQYGLVLQKAQADAKVLEVQVGAVAAKSYRLGRVSTMTVLLESQSSDDFLERAIRLDMMAQIDGRALARYKAAQDTAAASKRAIDQSIREQKKLIAVLAQKKKKAENALASIGGGSASSGFLSANSASAKPAPRNSDGSWPRESCSVNDPTTSGCITPRLLHAYQESRLAGFKRYTSCFSVRASGEHPKGRACDFAAAKGGFENVNAGGGDKAYGNRLAAYFVKNANRLGVLYVIWYRQIWMPGTGWRSYSGSGGPSATHTNHVHLSMI
jgi:hypothetical protein